MEPVVYQSTCSSWVTAVAVVAVCLAALGAAFFGVPQEPREVAAVRPPADAPVDVVRAPAPAAPPADLACRTCAMGAGKGML